MNNNKQIHDLQVRKIKTKAIQNNAQRNSISSDRHKSNSQGSIKRKESLKAEQMSSSNDYSPRYISPGKIAISDVPFELREVALKKSREEQLKCQQYLISRHNTDFRKWPIAPSCTNRIDDPLARNILTCEISKKHELDNETSQKQEEFRTVKTGHIKSNPSVKKLQSKKRKRKGAKSLYC